MYRRSEELYYVLLSLDVTYFVPIIYFHLLFGITSSKFTLLNSYFEMRVQCQQCIPKNVLKSTLPYHTMIINQSSLGRE